MRHAAFLMPAAAVALLMITFAHGDSAIASAGISADTAALARGLQTVAKKQVHHSNKGGGKSFKGGSNNKNNVHRNKSNNNKHNNANRNNNNNLNVNRNVNVNVTVSGRPVRGWVRRPYYGTIVGGVALGTIIAASAIPRAPASNLCWYWTDSSQSRGYWDYCA